MNLNEYLSTTGSLTVAQLRERVGALSDMQVRQWQHGYANRKPSLENCVAIERATNGAVTVEELRPGEQWARVKDKAWPHPKGRPVVDFSISKPAAEQAS